VARSEAGNNVVYVHAGQQVIADYARGAAAAAPSFRYVYGSYVDEPLLRHAGTGTTLPTSGTAALYYHRNQQYSIVGLSDAAGTLVERYAYTAYGELTILAPNRTARATSSFQNRYTYTGREWDPTLRLYYFRARWLEPKAGRFIGRDPLGYVDGMGLYGAYFAVRGVDPNGTNWNEPTLPIEEGKCYIGLDCVSSLGSGIGTHCGLVIQTNSSRHYLHCWGLFHPGGKSCQINRSRSDGATAESYYQMWLGLYDKSTCDCILKTNLRTYNASIKNCEYKLVPGKKEQGNCECNSNYAIKCLTRSCGMEIKWPKREDEPFGWNHRVSKCTAWAPKRHYIDYRCVTLNTCIKWETTDDAWCG
jgi:RHS repeat-associated protein